MAAVKRKFPSLLRQAEKDLKMKFKNGKPALRLSQNGRPRALVPKNLKGRSVIVITKRMAKTNEKLSYACILHEAREILLAERGVSATRSHRTAARFETIDRERLGLKKSVGWLLHDYLTKGRRRKKRPHWAWGK